MRCPDSVIGFANRVDSLGLLRAGLTTSTFGSSLSIQYNNSIPRSPRDFYFALREIEPASRFSRAEFTLLSRSCP